MHSPGPLGMATALLAEMWQRDTTVPMWHWGLGCTASGTEVPYRRGPMGSGAEPSAASRQPSPNVLKYDTSLSCLTLHHSVSKEQTPARQTLPLLLYCRALHTGKEGLQVCSVFFLSISQSKCKFVPLPIFGKNIFINNIFLLKKNFLQFSGKRSQFKL